MQTPRYTTELTYDPHESYEQFCARRQAAVEQGRQAVRERRISGDLFLFYEYLIERVGGNQYTWVGEETMAEAFRVDASTIKRWIAKLVRAGLIRRQRQFATSSRTYITAYDPTLLLDEEIEAPAVTATAEPQAASDQAEADPDQADQGSIPEALSFRRRSAPTFGADLPPDSIKVQHLNPGGGGAGDSRKNQALAPEIRHLLEREGVQGFYLAPQLQQQPIEELRAVSRYLDQQHNVRDRARLFAALAVGGFGALLLAGRVPQRPPHTKQRGGRPQAQAARTDDHLKYVAGTLAPYIQGGSAQPEAALPVSDPTPPTAIPAAASDWMQTWQQALDALRPTLTDIEFQTWFADAHLLHLDDRHAVVGVPNIFARDHVMTCYQAQIAQALATSCGRSVQVQIELGGS
jgi:hypothetical protein